MLARSFAKNSLRACFLLSSIFSLTYSASVFALDTWEIAVYDSGEVVYSAGHYRKILLGERGVGLASKLGYRGEIQEGIVQVLLDDQAKVTNHSLQRIDQSTFLMSGSTLLASQIRCAKKVKVLLRECESASGCSLSNTGGQIAIEWEFERSLYEMDLIQRGKSNISCLERR
jgi:hypothetical protein